MSGTKWTKKIASYIYTFVVHNNGQPIIYGKDFSNSLFSTAQYY